MAQTQIGESGPRNLTPSQFAQYPTPAKRPAELLAVLAKSSARIFGFTLEPWQVDLQAALAGICGPSCISRRGSIVSRHAGIPSVVQPDRLNLSKICSSRNTMDRDGCHKVPPWICMAEPAFSPPIVQYLQVKIMSENKLTLQVRGLRPRVN